MASGQAGSGIIPLLNDYIVGAALLVFVLCWFLIRWRWRGSVLAMTALLALAASLHGILVFRWQLAPAATVAFAGLLAVASGARYRRQPTHRRPWLSGSLFAAVTMASLSSLYLFPVRDLPEPNGDHAVGTADFTLVDRQRTGLLGAAEDEPRQLLVRAWYPARSVAGLRRRPYFSQAEAATTADGLGRLLGLPFLFRYLSHARTNSYEDAMPLIADEGSVDVIIYSHGYGSFAGQNTALMEALASHGYLVFALQHSYDASPTVLSDGTLLPMDEDVVASLRDAFTLTPAIKTVLGDAKPASRRKAHRRLQQQALARDDRLTTKSAEVWLDDRRFLLDALQAGAVPDALKPLVQLGSYDKSGQMGMSFGGSTSAALCMADRRCAAAVNLDGYDLHAAAFGRTIPVPLLMLHTDPAYTAQAFGLPAETAVHRGLNEFSYERGELAGLRADIHRLLLSDVRHLGLSDLSLFLRNPLKTWLLGRGAGRQLVQLENDLVLGFFNRYLAKSDNEFPAALLATYPALVEEERWQLRQAWLNQHPEDFSQRVLLETALGELELALYPRRAPTSVENFLAYVDAGHFDGASLYRVTRGDLGHGIDVVQGGLMGEAIQTDIASYERAESLLPRIPHETTTATGITNERGTIAFARLAPGTATSEFFFNIQDNPELDTGNVARNPDGQGYATFGRVLRGLPLLQRVQTRPTREAAPLPMLRQQLLKEPVDIVRATRVRDARAPLPAK